MQEGERGYTVPHKMFSRFKRKILLKLLNHYAIFYADCEVIFPLTPHPHPEKKATDLHESHKWSGQKLGWTVHPYGDAPDF
jgi:hypothetical protein